MEDKDELLARIQAIRSNEAIAEQRGKKPTPKEVIQLEMKAAKIAEVATRAGATPEEIKESAVKGRAHGKDQET